MKKAIYSLSLLMSASLSANSQSTLTTDELSGRLNTITTSVPFLLISPEARSGGMGDVGVASTPDANSIHWNPAKLAFNDKQFGVAISYTPWLRQLVNDINLAYLSGFYKLKNGNQAIGGSLRYFSLGNIVFTDIVGNETGQFNPNEFAVDVAYARQLGEEFSGGIALRYINSNLTGGILLSDNTATKVGQSVAADVSGFYTHDGELFGKDAVISAGLAITNIGSKISYTESGVKDFIPINLRLGPGVKFKLNEFNDISFNVDINKLLVPTPPIYDSTSTTDPAYGKDPDVSVAEGIFQSFGDAPGGFKEEIKEFIWAAGLEYWYDQQFAFRAGYFHEAATKGNRQYFTLGAGLRYNVFGLDFAYLIPTEQRHPLENTLRFTLTFNFDSLKSENKEE